MQGCRSVSELLELIDQGLSVEYLFFWGHTPRVPGVVDKSCLSNWFPACFTVNEVTYLSAEQFMMAEKARLFEDSRTREKILASRDPGRAKRLGRRVQGFSEEKWVNRRFEIVAAGVEAKFRQNEDLMEFLVGTGEKVLVEASPNDRIWGIGMAQHDARAGKPREWEGLNLLGFALMEARCRIRRV